MKCESCGHEHAGWVPMERLTKTAQARDEALSAAAAAEERATSAVSAVTTELEELRGRATSVDDLRQQLAALQGDKARLELQTGFMGAGLLDPEGLEVATTLWGALPEDRRPASVEAWLQDGAPKGVRAYLAAPTAAPGSVAPAAPAAAPPPPAAAPGEPAPPAAPAAPGFTRVGGSGGPPPSELTPDQIRTMPAADFKALYLQR